MALRGSRDECWQTEESSDQGDLEQTAAEQVVLGWVKHLVATSEG